MSGSKTVAFRCCACGTDFTLAEPPKAGAACIACGHLYVIWLNHKDFCK